MALPQPAEDLCFSSGALIEKDFNVDEFVSAIRKRVTIECLREDLDSYFRTLKNAMVELINKDYADFVALSANLVSNVQKICSRQLYDGSFEFLNNAHHNEPRLLPSFCR